MEENNTGRKIAGKVAGWAYAGINAAFGNYAPLIMKLVKIVAIVAGVLLLFIIMISCMFQIILHEIGFGSAADFAESMLQVEYQWVRSNIEDYFSSDSHKQEIENLLIQFDGNGNPVGGALQDAYQEFLDDYEQRVSSNTDEYTVYTGYTIDNGMDNFWKNDYKEYFFNIIEGKADDTLLSVLGSGLTAKIAGVKNVYKNYLDEVEAENLYATSKTENVTTETKTETYTADIEVTNYGYQYCGPVSEKPSYIAYRVYYLSDTAVWESMSAASGKTVKELQDMMASDTTNYESFIHPTVPTIHTTEEREREVTIYKKSMTYTIRLNSAPVAYTDTSNREFDYTDIEGNFNLAISFLQFLQDGSFGFSQNDVISANKISLKSMFLGSSLFLEKFSWRLTTIENGANNAITGGVTGVAGGLVSMDGQKIVDYALQFVGNPYVWGGNSLTNGIDCSHFVWQVLKNCGVYSGGYYTSSGWANLGTDVGVTKSEYMSGDSSKMQAGDIVVWNGHVAIYDGNGMIVEAKGAKYGITHDRAWNNNSKTFLGVRRFVSTGGSNITDMKGIYDYLVGCGFTKAGACGILGNIFQESGGKPDIYSSTGKYYGLCQWGGGRLTNLRNYCKANGLDYKTISGQIAFVVYELQTTYSELGDYLMRATNPQSAAQEFCVGFEACVGGNDPYTGTLYPKQVGRNYQDLYKRMSYAQQYYDKY